MSHPAWGAWIEICAMLETPCSIASHPAWGAWIEIFVPQDNGIPLVSHPAWGAWIEIVTVGALPAAKPGRTPHGVRGLKLVIVARLCAFQCRTPHGVRGLK